MDRAASVVLVNPNTLFSSQHSIHHQKLFPPCVLSESSNFFILPTFQGGPPMPCFFQPQPSQIATRLLNTIFAAAVLVCYLFCAFLYRQSLPYLEHAVHDDSIDSLVCLQLCVC